LLPLAITLASTTPSLLKRVKASRQVQKNICVSYATLESLRQLASNLQQKHQQKPRRQTPLQRLLLRPLLQKLLQKMTLRHAWQQLRLSKSSVWVRSLAVLQV
jgi:hypothetical protein